MSWKAPKVVELPVGMEINMYACATRTSLHPVRAQARELSVIR
jgi:coenzyme PQQ precursor peptide PqqA